MPPFISAESHSIDVFATLVALGKYNSFKLVDGGTVSSRYQDYDIFTTDGSVKYSFPPHSAGPFGNDISGQWMTSENFFRVLAFSGLGWKDIHASNIEIPEPSYAPQPHFTMTMNF